MQLEQVKKHYKTSKLKEIPTKKDLYKVVFIGKRALELFKMVDDTGGIEKNKLTKIEVLTGFDDFVKVDLFTSNYKYKPYFSTKIIKDDRDDFDFVNDIISTVEQGLMFKDE